jgi:hypothetical protein
MGLCLAGLALATLSGCTAGSAALGGAGVLIAGVGTTQTWVAGMTLPSPRYLEHQPQYFPPSPVFPLENELAQQQAVWAAPAPGLPGVPAPAPLAAPVPVLP